MRADVAVETRAPTIGSSDFDRLSNGERQSTSDHGPNCCPGCLAIVRNHNCSSPTVVKTHCDRGRAPPPVGAVTCIRGSILTCSNPLPGVAHPPPLPRQGPTPAQATCPRPGQASSGTHV